MAPISPPLTGASSMTAPSEAARAASLCAVAGAIVLMSITIVPGCIEENTPPGPSMTSTTSGESGSMVMMRAARRATSPGDQARRAP